MNFRILKKDFRRKKSVNLILLIFIVLATTFIAGGISNMVTVMNATDEFLEEAGIGDYLIVTTGEMENEMSENEKEIENFLKSHKLVKEYSVDGILYLSQTCFEKKNGENLKINNSVALSSYEISQQKFFDKNNKVINEIEDGYIYLSQKCMETNKSKIGDKITIVSNNGYRKEFELKGYVKDAFLGADMMGMHRFVVSNNDYKEIVENAEFPKGNIFSLKTDDIEQFVSDINECDFTIMFSGDRALIKMAYVMDLVIAAVLLMVSLCLIIISIIMLRFTIVFTVNEDYKEIGIMKAIGIRNGAIRRLYLTKYLVIAAVGAVIGFGVSIPFAKTLIQSVSEDMVVRQTGSTIMLQAVLGVIVVIVILLFAYMSTGRIKKLTPMDAIRNGNNGERFNKKGKIKLSKSKRCATTFMAANDVLSEFRKYVVLLLASLVGVWLVVMPTNTINTLGSSEISSLFSIPKSELAVANDEKTNEIVVGKDLDAAYNYMTESEKLLKDSGVPVEKVSMEVFFRLKVRKGDLHYKSISFKGLNTDVEKDYKYMEGVAPKYENEVAITHIIAERIDAKLGDTIYITTGKEEKPYVVTAIFQSMNNMGEGIRFIEDSEVDEEYLAGAFALQVYLDGVDEDDTEKIDEYIKIADKTLKGAQTKTLKTYLGDMIGGITEKIADMKVLILVVVIAINILVVVLMQKMFLLREQGKIAMLKAIGFSDKDIMKWQLKRMSLVVVVGIVLGTITSTPFSQITSGQVFKMMGASKVDFVINPLEVYAVYPVILLVATLLGCALTLRKIRKIETKEVNSIE